jgi:hypothetical protein
MKIRIAEEYPGEVVEKAGELHELVDQLAGVEKSGCTDPSCGCHAEETLHKALTQPLSSGAQFQHPALESSVKRARREMAAIRKEMERQIEKVLRE